MHLLKTVQSAAYFKRFANLMIRVLALWVLSMSLVPISRVFAACATITKITRTTCGLVLSSPGCYELSNSLAGSNNNDCIRIAASNVYLNLGIHSITGSGAAVTGAGIHVVAAAANGTKISNVVILGGPVPPGFLTGAFVSGFDTAVLIEASQVRVDALYVVGESYGFRLTGAQFAVLSNIVSQANVIAMISLVNSNNNVIDSVQAGPTADSFDRADGLSLVRSNGNIISNIFLIDEVFNGIKLIQSNNNKFLGGLIALVLNYGVYVNSSSGNEFAGMSTDGYPSGQPAIYIGCSDTGGPTGIRCNTASSGNSIDTSTIVTPSTSYGIAIDLGNKNNTVLNNQFSGVGIDDEYDANSCGANTWLANTFSTANRTCLH